MQNEHTEKRSNSLQQRLEYAEAFRSEPLPREIAWNQITRLIDEVKEVYSRPNYSDVDILEQGKKVGELYAKKRMLEVRVG